ncbi:MAG: twin-arginine translocase TatA/TatE family subunit [Anaerolineaceae bacterium]|nr:twin-arginine translocase TatA/TatE family subunit [Anaerolineaceae bacterium]
MEIFNIGILEFLFILLLAFIILGPKKAVELAGEVGRWVKDFVKSPFWREIVNTSKEIKDIPRKLMDEAEVQQTIDEINRTTTEVNQQLHQNSVGTILPPPFTENPDDPDTEEPDKA